MIIKGWGVLRGFACCMLAALLAGLVPLVLTLLLVMPACEIDDTAAALALSMLLLLLLPAPGLDACC